MSCNFEAKKAASDPYDHAMDQSLQTQFFQTYLVLKYLKIFINLKLILEEMCIK